jgi:hypothetical protein
MSKQKKKYRWHEYTRYFFSHLNQCPIWLEGSFERTVALCFEFDKEIIRYQSQPIRLRYRDAGGKERKYLPDFLVEYRNSRNPFAFVEAKSFRFYTAEVRETMRCVRLSLSDKGWSKVPCLKVITDQDIASGTRLANYQRLYSYKRIPVEKFVSPDKLKQNFSDPLTFGELRSWTSREGLQAPLPFAMLAHGYFKTDLDQVLKDDSVLEVA